MQQPAFSAVLKYTLTLASIGLWLAGCAAPSGLGDDASPEHKAQCGQLCLKNGETCSQYFARRNEEQRLLFEQAKHNYWLCLRKYPGFDARPGGPCLAPPPPEEAYDSCGPQLDECLAGCGLTLDELADTLQAVKNKANAAAEQPDHTPLPTVTPAPEWEVH